MKRIEVKLALPVVAPLLDVIKGMADSLRRSLAAPLGLTDLDAEFGSAWADELVTAQNEDVKALLALFNDDFFADGVIAFDEDNAEQIVRATAAVRLRLRELYLKALGDETLESGSVELEHLEPTVQKAFMCYLFLATIQELIIQHLDSSILES
ncbi:MAG: hypothetical protein JWM32_1304 [Verrucomicrobia bacterium]|nr:hypothetical protein [Verrucomicrobiota bacterium]